MNSNTVHKNARLILEAATAKDIGWRHWTEWPTDLFMNSRGRWLINGEYIVDRQFARIILRGLLHEKMIKEFREWVLQHSSAGSTITEYSWISTRVILDKLDEVRDEPTSNTH